MNESNTPERMLTAPEVADWLGTTTGRLSNLRSAGLGPAYVKTGHSVRYRRSDVETWLAENTVTPIGA